MQVEINTSRADLIKANLYIFPYLKENQLIFIIVALLIAYSNYTGVYPHKPDGIGLILAIISGILLSSICMLFGIIISILISQFTSSHKNGILGSQHYEIAEEGLIITTVANHSIEKWQGITCFFRTKRCIVIRIGFLYRIFPKRSFETDEHFNAFYDSCKSYLDK